MDAVLGIAIAISTSISGAALELVRRTTLPHGCRKLLDWAPILSAARSLTT